MESKNLPKIIFVLGAPGAGKGTQCEKIVNSFGFTHLSTSGLLREEQSREGSEFGGIIEAYTSKGDIVPGKITCSLLENAMVKTKKETGNNKFLIDGFPRNEDNFQDWQQKMSEKVDFLFVLFFDCSQDKCVERCIKRGRTDDNMKDRLKKRFNTFLNGTMLIINHYQDLGKVKQIDAHECPDTVFNAVNAVLNESQSQSLF